MLSVLLVAAGNATQQELNLGKRSGETFLRSYPLFMEYRGFPLRYRLSASNMYHIFQKYGYEK